jgi:hypothetical protein
MSESESNATESQLLEQYSFFDLAVQVGYKQYNILLHMLLVVQ